MLTMKGRLPHDALALPIVILCIGRADDLAYKSFILAQHAGGSRRRPNNPGSMIDILASTDPSAYAMQTLFAPSSIVCYKTLRVSGCGWVVKVGSVGWGAKGTCGSCR